MNDTQLIENTPLGPTTHYDFKDVDLEEVTLDGVRVVLEDLGEGFWGDYDDGDQDDEPLLRFTIYSFNTDTNEWEQVEDGSYCTLLPTDLSWEHRVIVLGTILSDAYNYVVEGSSVKGIGEFMSWFDMDDLDSVDYRTLHAIRLCRYVLEEDAADAEHRMEILAKESNYFNSWYLTVISQLVAEAN